MCKESQEQVETAIAIRERSAVINANGDFAFNLKTIMGIWMSDNHLNAVDFAEELQEATRQGWKAIKVKVTVEEIVE